MKRTITPIIDVNAAFEIEAERFWPVLMAWIEERNQQTNNNFMKGVFQWVKRKLPVLFLQRTSQGK